MLNDDTRKRLEDIVRGAIIEGDKDTCTTARNNLCSRFSTSTTVKRDFEGKSIIKEEQEQQLRNLADANDWWVNPVPGKNQYLARGGEAIVYLDSENEYVYKLNDAIYYATWLEFLNSILIHNSLFKDTAYTLVGFYELDSSLYAVLKQRYIILDAPVNLEDVKNILQYNGFVNTRRNDYYNKELGIILEDMHDENIIAKSNTLFFIDSVFYTVDPENFE